MTFKEFYNKYINWIVIGLICFVMLKGCQSCNKDRQMEYKSSQYEQVIDSLNNRIDTLNADIESLKNVNKLYINDIEHLKATNESLQNANKHYRNTNNTLVNTNKKLTEQNDIIK